MEEMSLRSTLPIRNAPCGMGKKRIHIGLKQAGRLCQMRPKERAVFLAEGLPILFGSAMGFWSAAQILEDQPREAEVLTGFAKEEAAKILILMDIVRCPPKLVSSRIGDMLGWFYSHLARLLYVDAMNWKPAHMAQLREYVDLERRAHYVDGPVGEYIFPNSQVFSRESQLYVDIAAYEDGEPVWNAPLDHRSLFPGFTPPALLLAKALSAVGAFTVAGQKAISDIWGAVEFKVTENPHDAQRLTQATLKRLIDEKLPREDATQGHVDALYRHWQMPMYGLDFGMTDVPLADLEAEREANSWAEIGERPYGH